MDHPARGDADAYRRYFAGMDASMDQKAAFLSAHLAAEPDAVILDLGCGSGALSARMAALAPGARVVGIDIDADTVSQASAMHALPNLEFQTGDAAAVHGPADAVVSCSLLHHVYTYAARPYDEAAAETALRAHVASLRPGGLLVLRDFCRDGVPGETCILELAPEDEGSGSGSGGGLSTADLLRDFAARARPLDPLGCGFPLEDLGLSGDGWRRFRLHRHWAAEFMLRKDYRADWEAELREEYAFWPLRRFAEIVEGAGARVLRAAPVRNPWVVANRWEGRVRRLDERGHLLPWPATNMVLVAQKAALGGAVRLRQRRLDPSPPSYLRQSAWLGADGSVWDLVQRPTGAVDFLPYSTAGGRLRVMARDGWPRPALVAMGRDAGGEPELRSGHVVEMLSLASDGGDPRADFMLRAGMPVPDSGQVDEILRFLPSAGTADEVSRVFCVPFDVLPAGRPSPTPAGDPDAAFDHGALRSFDATGLLRAAEVGMMPEARLELAARVLHRRLGLHPGAWVGETFSDALPTMPARPLLEASREAGLAFVAAPNGAGFLHRVRSEFVEDCLGSAGLEAGGHQVLELTAPSHHDNWTVSVLPVARDGSGRILVGLEHRTLPAAQLRFGDAGMACVPAWRLGAQLDSPDPLREGAALKAGCPAARLVRLGGAYHPSLGISSERVQPFVVAADALADSVLQRLCFVALEELLDGAGQVRDGHLLVSAFRLSGALGGVQA